MKLLIITEYYPSTEKLDIRGGIEARNYYIASYIARLHKVQVLCSAEIGKPRKQVINNVDVVRVGKLRPYTRTDKISRIIFVISALWRGLFMDFDLIEGSGFWGMILAFILGIIKRKPKTVMVADTIETYTLDADLLSGFILRLTERFLLTGNWNKIICISKTVKHKVSVFNKNNLEVVYCGTDLSKIRRIGQMNKKFDVCCIARLVPYKRINDLIEAINIINQRKMTVKCAIIGDGEEITNLRKLISRYALDKNIILTGFLPDHNQVLKYLKKSNIFCLPSGVEGFGIATIEAMATGIPVILPKLAIHHEVTQNKGVLFYKLGNTEDLADKIIMLIRKTTLYNKLAEEAILISRNYDWQKLACRTQQIYEDLCIN